MLISTPQSHFTVAAVTQQQQQQHSDQSSSSTPMSNTHPTKSDHGGKWQGGHGGQGRAQPTYDMNAMAQGGFAAPGQPRSMELGSGGGGGGGGPQAPMSMAPGNGGRGGGGGGGGFQQQQSNQQQYQQSNQQQQQFNGGGQQQQYNNNGMGGGMVSHQNTGYQQQVDSRQYLESQMGGDGNGMNVGDSYNNGGQQQQQYGQQQQYNDNQQYNNDNQQYSDHQQQGGGYDMQGGGGGGGGGDMQLQYDGGDDNMGAEMMTDEQYQQQQEQGGGMVDGGTGGGNGGKGGVGEYKEKFEGDVAKLAVQQCKEGDQVGTSTSRTRNINSLARTRATQLTRSFHYYFYYCSHFYKFIACQATMLIQKKSGQPVNFQVVVLENSYVIMHIDDNSPVRDVLQCGDVMLAVNGQVRH
jgi:hypothetical protein